MQPGQIPQYVSPPGVVSRPPAEARIGPPTEADAQRALDQEEQHSDRLRDLFQFSYESILYNQPSPTEAPPFRADVLDATFNRAMIAPPTAPGNADGLLGAQECAAAEASISGVAVPVLVPATVGDFVDVITFTVPQNNALYLHSIGAWGHDFLAAREVIRWRVLASGRVVTSTRELGLLGSPDTPVRVHAILGEAQVLTIQAQNLDTVSGSLVEAIAFGWVFPVLRNDDTLRGLLDPQRGPRDRGRFGPGNFGGGSGAGAGGPGAH